MTGITSSKPLNIVAVSGGLNTPSKTESLVHTILDELSEAIDIKVHFIKLSEIGTIIRRRILSQPASTARTR